MIQTLRAALNDLWRERGDALAGVVVVVVIFVVKKLIGG